MTRINVGIEPSELPDAQLLAEHREIKRIPNAVAKGRCDLTKIPDQFTLGKGHVCFFYDKLKYLLVRYRKLHKEAKRRGFNVTDFSGAWTKCPHNLMRGYRPRPRDRKIILGRFKEKGIVTL